MTMNMALEFLIIRNFFQFILLFMRILLNVSPIPSACCSSRLANKVSMIFILLPLLTRTVKMII